MTTLFISDLHLDEDNPSIITVFHDFMDTLTRNKNIDALYILGDLFEAWVGDDEQTPLHQAVCHRLNQLTSHGTPVYFIHGNRDFLIGKRFAKQSGCILLPEYKRIELYDRPTLIMHGDTLCTDDVCYQAFRKKAQNKWLQRLFLCLPLWLRKKIAVSLRNKSKKHTQSVDMAIMDVNPLAVSNVMKQHQVDLLIHGHTHRPAIHRVGSNKKRIVLGAWHTSGNVLICKKDHSLRLKNFTEFHL